MSRGLLPALILYVLTCTSSLEANVPIRPGSVEELGFNVKEAVVRVPAEVVYVNYEAIRRDFPQISKLSNVEIDAIILQNAGLVTERQLSLADLLIEPFSILTNAGAPSVRTPPIYGRAGVTDFVDPLGKFIGAVDLKGIGRTNWARDMPLFGSDNFKRFLQGSDSYLEAKTVKFIESEMKRISETQRKSLRNAKKTLSGQELIRAIQIDQREGNLKTKFYQELLEFNETPPDKRQDSKRVEILKLMRSLDYADGLLPLDRAMKEVIHQQTIQALFNETNERTGSNLQTVENYFVIALPFRKIGSGKRAAILGRQATWRDGLFSEALEIPLKHDGISAGAGEIQTCGAGCVVDFELTSIEDLRLGSDFRYDTDGTTGLEHKLASALKDWELGNKTIFDRLVRENTEEVQRALHEEPRSANVKPSGTIKADIAERFQRFMANENPSLQEAKALAQDLSAPSVFQSAFIFKASKIFPEESINFFKAAIRNPGRNNYGIILSALQGLQDAGRFDLAFEAYLSAHRRFPNTAAIAWYFQTEIGKEPGWTTTNPDLTAIAFAFLTTKRFDWRQILQATVYLNDFALDHPEMRTQITSIAHKMLAYFESHGVSVREIYFHFPHFKPNPRKRVSLCRGLLNRIGFEIRKFRDRE